MVLPDFGAAFRSLIPLVVDTRQELGLSARKSVAATITLSTVATMDLGGSCYAYDDTIRIVSVVLVCIGSDLPDLSTGYSITCYQIRADGCYVTKSGSDHLR